MSVKLQPGAAAPEFELQDQHGNTVSSQALRGKKTVLFVYPAAMTPGCTKEACDFRDSVTTLAALNYQVLGLSKDSVVQQLKFAERERLSYPLLSDPELTVHKEFGAYGAKTLYGKVLQGVLRSTFVINEDWIVEHALYNVKATGHVARIVKLLSGGV